MKVGGNSMAGSVLNVIITVIKNVKTLDKEIQSRSKDTVVVRSSTEKPDTSKEIYYLPISSGKELEVENQQLM